MEFDTVITYAVKITLCAAFVSLVSLGVWYIFVRVRERYLKGHALATQIIMQSVKPISVGGRVGVVTGAYDSSEAIVKWIDDSDSDGDGVPDKDDEDPKRDDRHRLLVELCRATLQDEKYRAAQGRLMTADDAQKLGGHFADRNRWQQAVDYGKDNHLVYTSNDGTHIDRQNSGGAGVSDLLAKLATIDPILKSAVDALPATRRTW